MCNVQEKGNSGIKKKNFWWRKHCSEVQWYDATGFLCAELLPYTVLHDVWICWAGPEPLWKTRHSVVHRATLRLKLLLALAVTHWSYSLRSYHCDLKCLVCFSGLFQRYCFCPTGCLCFTVSIYLVAFLCYSEAVYVQLRQNVPCFTPWCSAITSSSSVGTMSPPKSMWQDWLTLSSNHCFWRFYFTLHTWLY